MAEFFLEIFSEEIPARMQAKAENDLNKWVITGLQHAGLTYTKASSVSGPRRLAVSIEGVPEKSADVREERKGPKVGAPEQAVAGFLRGAGLSDISEADIRSDPKKGDFYVAVKDVPGRTAEEIIAELIPQVMADFHWPKSMRTGPNAASAGVMRWVRPIQRIVCLIDGQVVPFEVDGLASGNQTEGHRVHGRGPYTVTGFADYASQLSGKGHVLLSRDERREKIAADAKAVCDAAGLELVEDAGLLEEVVGLAEWPFVILGDMDPAYLELPPEVIQLSMRTHQKYFSVRDPKTGQLAPHFVVVANIEAADGGKAIAAGNRKVLSARLDDGVFFWENDKKTGLEAMVPKLGTIKFKDELGSIGDKVERVAALARELAPTVGADADLAERAARLCKADLVSEMVYEFPELQGVMGRYYALAALKAPLDPAGHSPRERGEKSSPASGALRPAQDESVSEADGGGSLAGLSEAKITQVADAIRDHYKPQGPSDAVPSDPVSIAVALADKLDTLVGFWAIDEKPTGSKDPFALRRAALGVVRIVLENGVRIGLRNEFYKAGKSFPKQMSGKGMGQSAKDTVKEALHLVSFEDLLSFFADRLKQYLRDQGQRHDLIDAVFALGEDDLVLITKRVEALGAFLDSEDGANLLAGYKRAANILKAEEKKGWRGGAAVDAGLIAKGPDEEQALFKALIEVEGEIGSALETEDFTAAMAALATLRAPVDAFFEGVKVNDEDEAVRANRLALLETVRGAIGQVADFSRIEG